MPSFSAGFSSLSAGGTFKEDPKGCRAVIYLRTATLDSISRIYLLMFTRNIYRLAYALYHVKYDGSFVIIASILFKSDCIMSQMVSYYSTILLKTKGRIAKQYDCTMPSCCQSPSGRQ